MTDLPSIGTIVRLPAREVSFLDECYAVVVPNHYAPRTWRRSPWAFTRILDNKKRAIVTGDNRGWFLDRAWRWIDVDQDDVPDEIWRLAGRCLLDPNFVPFVSEE